MSVPATRRASGKDGMKVQVVRRKKGTGHEPVVQGRSVKMIVIHTLHSPRWDTLAKPTCAFVYFSLG